MPIVPEPNARGLITGVALCLALLAPAMTHGLAMSSYGNAPVAAQDDWKPGVVDVVNDTCRVYQVWVNGNEHFFFRGDTEKLNQALKKFAAIENEVREVILTPYPGFVGTMDRIAIACDWELRVPGGLYLGHARMEEGTRVRVRHATLTIFTGSRRIDLSRLKIPSGVTVLEAGDLIDRYLEGLRSPQGDIRQDAVSELGEFAWHGRAPEVAAVLLERLKKDEEHVRNMAATVLGRFAKAAATVRRALEAGRMDPSEEVRQTITETLDAMDATPDAVPSPLRVAQSAILDFLGKKK